MRSWTARSGVEIPCRARPNRASIVRGDSVAVGEAPERCNGVGVFLRHFQEYLAGGPYRVEPTDDLPHRTGQQRGRAILRSFRTVVDPPAEVVDQQRLQWHREG